MGVQRATRPKKRDLVRWTPDMDIQLGLIIQKVCNRHGIKLPWDDIGKMLGPKISGGAIVQHLAKLRLRRLEVNLPVPGPLQRGNKMSLAMSSGSSATVGSARTKRAKSGDHHTSEMDPDEGSIDENHSSRQLRKSKGNDRARDAKKYKISAKSRDDESSEDSPSQVFAGARADFLKITQLEDGDIEAENENEDESAYSDSLVEDDEDGNTSSGIVKGDTQKTKIVRIKRHIGRVLVLRLGKNPAARELLTKLQASVIDPHLKGYQYSKYGVSTSVTNTPVENSTPVAYGSDRFVDNDSFMVTPYSMPKSTYQAPVFAYPPSNSRNCIPASAFGASPPISSHTFGSSFGSYVAGSLRDGHCDMNNSSSFSTVPAKDQSSRALTMTNSASNDTFTGPFVDYAEFVDESFLEVLKTPASNGGGGDLKSQQSIPSFPATNITNTQQITVTDKTIEANPEERGAQMQSTSYFSDAWDWGTYGELEDNKDLGFWLDQVGQGL